MRTDAIIDKRQVKVPYSSHIGFSKWRAQVGDLILFTEGGRTVTGRMIGRVHYAPALGETPIIRDYILCVCLNDALDYTFERWVNPIDVVQVEPMTDEHARKRIEVTAWFLSDLKRESAEELRRTVEYGAIPPKYRAFRDKLAEDRKAFESRHPKGHDANCKICRIVESEVRA